MSVGENAFTGQRPAKPPRSPDTCWWLAMAWKGPPISELRNEARNLEYLLRDYLDDRAFITRNPRGTILYFVDAHEIKSYLIPITMPT